MYSVYLALAVFGLHALGAPSPVPVKPNVSLPFALKLGNLSTTLVEHDRARALAFRESHRKGSVRGRSVISASSAVSNVSLLALDQFVSYTTTVGIGSPPTEYTLLVDTGSSNTWVGASKRYVETSTSHPTLNSLSISYGSGFFEGVEFIDMVTLSPSLVIPQQSIGVATSSKGFVGIDGIIGIGPTDLTQGTAVGLTAPFAQLTVTDNLVRQGLIEKDLVGISFNPITSKDGNPELNGEITFGTTDPTKFTGSIEFVPITKTSPASDFFGIDQRITYGSDGIEIMSNTSGIVDTGTTLVLLPSDAFARYQQATNATLDPGTGFLKISPSQYDKLQGLYFHIGPTVYELIPDAQIWPRALNTLIGGTPGNTYLVIGNLQTPTGNGLDFINGFTFLQMFYSVFDSENSQVGFATTPHTKDKTY